MSKIWKIFEENPRLQKHICSELGVSPLFAQILVNRNIKTPEVAHSFLFGGLEACGDPFLMKDMEKSVLRIKKAISKKEKILIYGDYDVDGVTSTGLLASVLKEMGTECETFIPNRLEDGYGVNVRAIALARERGVNLIITVDCGINSFKEIDLANEYGIDVIITDHHEIKEGLLPSAYAVIDTHRSDCNYPFKGLAGVGVAYKLAKALLRGYDETIADKHLDLVSLGTIADVVPLIGENRILAREGLKRLKNTDKLGLKALFDVARIAPESITSRHVGFMIGPRINAMGRVGSANVALDLLMSTSEDSAREIASILERENRNRQQIQRDLHQDVSGLVKSEVNLEEDEVIVLSGEAWHPGVLGIVASKITEEYNMPTILISTKDGKGKGSGRSIEGFNLFESMKNSSVYLQDFGGHEAACGLKISEEQIDEFRKSLNIYTKKHFEAKEEILPELKIDLNLPFSQIGKNLIQELELLAPYGPENLEPIFSTNSIKVKNIPRTLKGGGFKFHALCGNLTCEVITFRKGNIKKPQAGNMINLAYTPSLNTWQGIETIQLNIKDLKHLK